MDEQAFLDIVMQNISIPYLLAFIFLSVSIFEKTKLKVIELNLFKKEVKITKRYLVFILALIVAIPFYFLIDGETNTILMKLIISYAVATSCYELGIKKIVNLFKKK